MKKEFIFTAAAEEFVKQYPQIHEALYLVFDLANVCLGRNNYVRKENPKLDTILFNIGHSSRDDFHECMFLALNNHGDGALKILRGLFEKAVTLAYLLKNPHLVNNFIKYYPINLHKVWKGAELAGIKRDEWDTLVTNNNELSVACIENSFKEAKNLFQQTDCEKCGTFKSKVSWDKDLASMVREVGEPYKELYLPSYAIANLTVHTNIFNAYLPDEDESRVSIQLANSKLAITASLGLMIDILKKQNEHFNLKIDTQKLVECDQQYVAVRNELLGAS